MRKVLALALALAAVGCGDDGARSRVCIMPAGFTADEYADAQAAIREWDERANAGLVQVSDACEVTIATGDLTGTRSGETSWDLSAVVIRPGLAPRTFAITVRHELGHVLGAMHTADIRDLMHSPMSWAQDERLTFGDVAAAGLEPQLVQGEQVEAPPDGGCYQARIADGGVRLQCFGSRALAESCDLSAGPAQVWGLSGEEREPGGLAYAVAVEPCGS